MDFQIHYFLLHDWKASDDLLDYLQTIKKCCNFNDLPLKLIQFSMTIQLRIKF